MNEMEKKKKFFILQGLELQTFRRSVRSQSLYHLSYLGSYVQHPFRIYWPLATGVVFS
jgi:hypothetical protein